MGDEGKHPEQNAVAGDSSLGVFPPARPGVRYVRIPLYGIVIADDGLRQRVDRYFHTPMIVLALLVLPLLLIEIIYLHQFDKNPSVWMNALYWMSLVAFSIIWLAFLVEFIIKIAIAECRFEYLKHNWLDVIIIIAPVLRPFAVAKLAKTSRVVTLRGVGVKFARYVFSFVVGMEATERLLEKWGWKVRRDRKNPEQMTRRELIGELKRLRRLGDQWEVWYEQQQIWEAGMSDRQHPQRPPLKRMTVDDVVTPAEGSNTLSDGEQSGEMVPG